MKHVVEQDEDGMFIAECPSLPECISQGKTPWGIFRMPSSVIYRKFGKYLRF
jgi:predicted RNase H-like HicB family nuclease